MTAIAASHIAAARPGLRALTFAIAAPALAVALSWGLVDACAFTQHSLMGLYTVAGTAA